MKYLKFLFLLCCYPHYGQQLISKQVLYEGELIVIELADIDELRIEQSPSSILSIEMEGQGDVLSMLSLNKTPELLVISSTELINQTVNTIEKFCKIQPLYNSYSLKIPKGAQVEVSYGEGNFSLDHFSGDLTLNFNRGDVNLINFQGHCEISLYAGNIMAKLKNTFFDIDTSLGRFTTDLTSEAYTEKSHHYKGSYGNAKNFLKVKTVRANIDLKTAVNQ
ncbi:DUF4097 domain-containing protein [Flavobacteriaceae bacterium F08102]|nr:DUF4097 domain-containing protein [Flavobacteriaceae bacterium F08102]